MSDIVLKVAGLSLPVTAVEKKAAHGVLKAAVTAEEEAFYRAELPGRVARLDGVAGTITAAWHDGDTSARVAFRPTDAPLHRQTSAPVSKADARPTTFDELFDYLLHH